MFLRNSRPWVMPLEVFCHLAWTKQILRNSFWDIHEQNRGTEIQSGSCFLVFFSGWLVVMLWRFYIVAKFGSSFPYVYINIYTQNLREVQLTHLLLNYPQPVEVYRFIGCLCSHICKHIYIYIIYIGTQYVLCLSCFGTINFILAHPDQQRSQIHYCLQQRSRNR